MKGQKIILKTLYEEIENQCKDHLLSSSVLVKP